MASQKYYCDTCGQEILYPVPEDYRDGALLCEECCEKWDEETASMAPPYSDPVSKAWYEHFHNKQDE